MDPLVLAQPAVHDIYQPGRESISSMEAGQGLRARGMALEQQQIENERANAEYARQQKIKELLGQNKYDDAKSYMTLAERNQLVNLQGNVLEQKIKGIELDMKEKALNDAYGFIDRATKLDPKKDTFDDQVNSLVTDAAPVAGLNPAIAGALNATINAKKQERLAVYRKPAELALSDLRKIRTGESVGATGPEDTAPAEQPPVWDRIKQWESDYADVLSGPLGQQVTQAKNDMVKEMIAEGKLTAAGGLGAFKPGEVVTDPASGRQVIWATSPASRIDVATGEPLYVRIMDPNNLSQEVLLRNPKIKGWGDAGAQKYLSEDPNASGLPTPVPDTISW